MVMAVPQGWSTSNERSSLNHDLVHSACAAEYCKPPPAMRGQLDRRQSAASPPATAERAARAGGGGAARELRQGGGRVGRHARRRLAPGQVARGVARLASLRASRAGSASDGLGSVRDTSSFRRLRCAGAGGAGTADRGSPCPSEHRRPTIRSSAVARAEAARSARSVPRGPAVHPCPRDTAELLAGAVRPRHILHSWPAARGSALQGLRRRDLSGLHARDCGDPSFP